MTGTTTVNSSLAAAKRARAAAREHLDDAAHALDRARQVHAAAVADVQLHDQAAAEFKATAARRLAAHIIGGGLGLAATAPDAGDSAARSTARSTAEIAEQALAGLAADHATAVAELQRAQETVATVVDTTLTAEANELGRELLEARARVEELCTRLRAFPVPLPGAAAMAVDPPSPLNAGAGHWWAQLQRVTPGVAAAEWQQRRAELLADPEPAIDSAAEAA